jgi:5-methylcytosine-specific restriction endonuclease McrA
MCGSYDLVQVHHIIPAASGGSDDYKNLITLCYRDHNTVHRNMDQYSNLLSELANRRENGVQR